MSMLLASLVTTVPVTWYLTLGLVMFCLGGVGVIVRRNPVVVFMCIELMLNAVNLTFLTFAAYGLYPGLNIKTAYQAAMNGQMMVIFVMAVAAAEVAVGLEIIAGSEAGVVCWNGGGISRLPPIGQAVAVGIGVLGKLEGAAFNEQRVARNRGFDDRGAGHRSGARE